MTHATIVTLSVLGVAGQALVVILVVVGRQLRPLLWGYELWAAFLVSAIATGGSLFFSEIAGFVPCELCWYQRICMYPLSLLTLFAAAHNDYRVVRYLLPLPVVGAGVSVYHLLIENSVIAEPSACRVGGGGCAVKWINEFGYMTIPTLALTAFLLLIALFVLASLGPRGAATVTSDD
jgi:disulfide bond formation protein DsbB